MKNGILTPDERAELERIRAENRELRRKLVETQARLTARVWECEELAADANAWRDEQGRMARGLREGG